MVSPKPVSLTQVDATSYEGAFEPEPLLIVGPVPGGGGGGGGDVASVNGKTGTVVLAAPDVGAVPTSRTVAGKPLTANVTLGIPDITGLEDNLGLLAPWTALNTVGAATVEARGTADEALTLADQAYTVAGASVPQSRTISGKALNTDITLTKVDVGLASVDNTSDVNKPVSTATQTALDAKVPTSRTVAGKPLTADVTLAKGDVGLGNVDNTSDASKPVSTATTTQLNLKAPLASPAFTGTPTGITKAHVGLGNVDNTSDANKPVSTAQATAISAKVGSPNSTVTGVAYYANIAALPNPGVVGVIYYVDAV